MRLRSTAMAWGGVMCVLHWGMLAVLASTIPLGWYMTDLPPTVHKVRLYALHKSIGLTLLALAILRVCWRAAERRPVLPPMPQWQARAAGVTHVALYALMFAIPLSGWLYNSAAGFPLRWFGLLRVPALATSNPTLKSLAHGIHESAVWIFLALLALHLAAALKHHFIDRDRTLVLMLPGLKVPGSGTGS